jgi:hypothetical protein
MAGDADAEDDGGEELPEGFEEEFWKLVLLLNVGPIALAVAFYLAVFRGVSRPFWAALVVGAVALGFAARTYRRARATLVEGGDG